MTILERFIQGDEDALEIIIKTYTASLARYCYSILCNYYDAEDSVQMTFIKLHQSRNRIKAEDNFTSYLYKIAYHTSLDIIRVRKKIGYSPKAIQDESYTVNFDSGFPQELREALLLLKPTDRALVYDRVVEEKNYKELSKIYGKSESSLRKRYERAREKMKKELNRHDSISRKGK